MTAMLDPTLEEDPLDEVALDIVPGLEAAVVLGKPGGASPIEGVLETIGAARSYDAVFLGTGKSESVEHGEGKDPSVIHGGSGAYRIVGGDHGETICAGLGEDDVDGGAGNDLIYGGGGADILRGGEDDDLLVGGSGADWLYGDGGADLIFGGEGDDQIILELDADVVTGGAGADTFFMRSGQGVITDFTPGEDVLNLATFVDFASLWEMKKVSVEADGDIEIALGAENTLVLCDTRLADLDAADFVFGFA
jgi:serralysin